MTFELFPDQVELYERTRQALRKSRRVLVQLPTGGGKTVIGSKMLANATAKGHTSWFMLHRRELVKQSVVTLTAAAGLPIGIVAAGFPGNRHQPVQVCSIGTVGRRLDMLPAPTLMLWDECHHLAAASWAGIMAKFPDAVHIGLSATPERLDGTGLGKYFDDMVCGPTVRELIDAGRLCDYLLYAPKKPDLSGVHSIGGDFNKKELAAAMSKSAVTGDALTHYQRYAPGKRAILFAWSIEASVDIVRQFNAAGIAAEHVDGATDDVVRDNAIAKFRRGETLVLSNVNLFSEGFDVPAVEAVFDLAPTQSLSMYLQRCGRALRVADGKEQALLFDHAGNSERHGLPDADRIWSLDGKKRERRSASDGPPIKQCNLCFAVVSAAASVCRHCGYKFQTQSREVEQVEGELSPVERQRVDAMVKDQRLAETVDDLKVIGQMRGYKSPERWAAHVWNGRQAKQAGDEAAAWARGCT